MAYLTATNGPRLGTDYELKGGHSVLGRHPDCDIVVDIGAVSRRHAHVSHENGRYYVEDLNSRNGTYVNERQLSGRQELTEGDRIRICDIVFTFRSESRQAKPPSVPTQAGPTVLVDDAREGNSTIMSKLDVSTDRHGIRLSTTPGAKLEALIEITQNLGKSLSLDEVLPQLLDSLFKIFMQADRGFIVLLGEDGSLKPRWTKFRHPTDDDTVRISRTVINRVVESKEAVLSADAGSDDRFKMSQSVADFQIRSVICAPLIDSENRAIGALQIDTKDQRHRFREQDLEVLVSIAWQAAIAIDKAHMHEQMLQQRELQRDLELARQVQEGFLPEQPPGLSNYYFYNYYKAANHVGGDCYDYIQLSPSRVAILVADVVGHGVAAALLMAKLSAVVRFCLAAEEEPARAVIRLNQTLFHDHMDGRFITMVLTVVDAQKHKATVVNAGHSPALIRRSTGNIDSYGKDVAGLPLLVLEDYSYRDETFDIHLHDTVVLYTDGLNEAADANDEQFGHDRLRNIMESTSGIAETGQRIVDEVDRFMGNQPQQDDMCLVCYGRI